MTQDPAKGRLIALLVLRLAGFLVMIGGLLLWRTEFFGITREVAGKIFVAAGLFQILVIPAVLLRFWRAAMTDEKQDKNP